MEDEPGFDAVTLTAKTYALLTRVSRELVEDATNLDGMLRQVFADVAAKALDGAILFGTGTDPQPRGIWNTAGITTVSMGANGAAIATGAAAWTPFLDAMAALEAANAGPRPRW